MKKKQPARETKEIQQQKEKVNPTYKYYKIDR